MIKTLFLHPLGPSLVLALGGLLLLLLRRYRRPAAVLAARVALPASFLFLLAAGILLVTLRTGPAGRTLLDWNWQPLAVGGSALSWRLDGWNWLAAFLVLMAAAVTLALQGLPGNEDAAPLRCQRTLWLAAAALAFVLSDNLVTLACGWVALDLMLTLRLMPGEDAQPAGRAWFLLGLGGLVVLAALIFQGDGGARSPLIGGSFGSPVLPLLWLAGMIRTGAYPLHFWLTGQTGHQWSDEVVLHLLAPLPGIWLLARLHLLAGTAWLHRPEWAALGALALLGTALAAWVSLDETTTWRWLTVNRASLVVLTAYVAGRAGPPAVLWPAITFTLGAGLLALGLSSRRHLGWHLPVWLGGLATLGFPGTPGFLARWVLVWPTDLAQGAVKGTPSGLPFGLLLFVLVLVAEILLAAALWHISVTGDEAPADDEDAAAGAVANGAVIAEAWPPAAGLAAAAGERLATLLPLAPLADGRPAAPSAAATYPASAPSAAPTYPATAASAAVFPAPASPAPVSPLMPRPADWFAAPARPGAAAVTTVPAQAVAAPRRAGEMRATAVWGMTAAVILLTAATLLWGLFPRQPVALAGLLGSGLPLTFGQALGGARRSVWAGLLIAASLGGLLGWLRPQIFTGMRGWQRGILAVVSLEWLYQIAGLALGFLGSGLQYFAALGEGEGYVGWLVLAGLILWVLLRS